MKISEEEKKGIVSLLIDYFDGKKTYMAAAVVLFSGLTWVGTYLLSAFGNMDPVLASGIRTIVEFCGAMAAGLIPVFLRMAISKKTKAD